MSICIWSNILIFVLLLLLPHTIFSDCPNFSWTDHKPDHHIWNIVGEWRVLNCSVINDEVDVTLWKGKKKITIDGERIKAISKNVFNISTIQLSDEGKYSCKACGYTKPSQLRVNVLSGRAFAKPEITKKPSGRIEYGSTVTLECAVKDSLSYEILWFNGDNVKLKSISRDDYRNIVQRKILTISNFTNESEDYYCQIRRYPINYISKATVTLELEELFKPTISNIPGNETLIEHENNHSVVNYSVSGTPSPNIAWYKFTNGTQYVIATCCGKTKKCSPVSENDIEVTMHSFVIKNTSYKDHDNVTFICQATNVKGKEEKKFTMFVKTEPRLVAPNSEMQLYEKNMRLPCILSKDANPINISYSWTFCDKRDSSAEPESCKNENNWEPLPSEKKNVLKISPPKGGIRLYRCTAGNDIGKADLVWTIVQAKGQDIPRGVCDNIARLESEKGESKNNGIIMWQGIAGCLAIVLLLTLFLTYRRRKILKQESVNV